MKQQPMHLSDLITYLEKTLFELESSKVEITGLIKKYKEQLKKIGDCEVEEDKIKWMT